MASKAAHKRLTKEYMNMQKSPPPFVWAAPEESNILHWNFLIRGPPDSPYQGGEYHGVLLFPPEYPFKPPGIKMLTPSGRFQVDKKICFSMSDFHPGTWNPAWSVATICTGLLSFMLSEEMTTGGMTSTDVDKRVLAARSHDWNIKQAKFREAFPEYSQPQMKDLPNMGESDRGKADDASKLGLGLSTTSSKSNIVAPPPSEAVPTAIGRRDVAATEKKALAKKNDGEPGAPARAGWKRTLLDRWHYFALFAVALVISRLSSG